MAGKSSSYRLCLCFSTENIYIDAFIHNYEKNRFLWYLIDPLEVEEANEVVEETQRIIKPTFIGPKNAPLYFGCAYVKSKFFTIGGCSPGATWMDPLKPYDSVFVCDPFSSSTSNQWLSATNMNGPKEEPLVVVPPPSFGDQRDVVFAFGSESDPINFMEKLSCDPYTGEWKWTIIPPPSEYPRFYYKYKKVYRAGFAIIDGNRKLLVLTFHGLLIFNMDTNMWDCDIEKPRSNYPSINKYGTYFGQVPIVDNVWYVRDDRLEGKVFGFDLQTQKWFEVCNVVSEKYLTHFLVQIGDKSIGLVCAKESLEQWEVYCIVFEVQKNSDGSLRACNLSKTPSYFGEGIRFLHCVVL
ncbi:hypothetical protein FRX31_031531 [Thalictrum thalictroides]|uniref:Uncharacterized protein n=1 Tax=Thalictrum thalictroides TaxID=46969 RepID=A0A7J6V369_THATH|nr:hypothetical protein FRX31_031531 [Thalictrum thalictroides]